MAKRNIGKWNNDTEIAQYSTMLYLEESLFVGAMAADHDQRDGGRGPNMAAVITTLFT